MRGLFISFEGIDKSGKSTQAKLLVAHLEAAGYRVMMTHEPGGTAVGQKIRELVLHSKQDIHPTAEMLLFAADRAHHVTSLILPALSAGKVGISDRYVDSTLAYQGYGRGLDLDRLRAIQRIATEGLMPDLTFWVDVDLTTSRARLALEGESADRMESEGDAMYHRVREGYAALCAAEPTRFVRLDGRQPVEMVFQTLLRAVNARLAAEHSQVEDVQKEPS